MELAVEQQVIFAGYRSDIADLLAASDIFLLSSIKGGLPMVLLEAMASGLPVISTNVGAIPTVVTDGQEGSLVPPSDPAALSDAIIGLWHSPAQRKTMGDNAREKFRRQYSREAMGEKYLQLYQKLRSGTTA